MSAIVAPQTKYTNKYAGNSTRAKKGKCDGCATSLVDSLGLQFPFSATPPKIGSND